MDPRLLDELAKEHGLQGSVRIELIKQVWKFALVGLVLMIGVLGLIGLRQDFFLAASSEMFWVKVGLPLSLAGLIGVAWWRSLHPGFHARRLCYAAIALLGVYWMIALNVVLPADPDTLSIEFWGNTWLECVAYIALMSVPMMVALLWASRRYGALHASLSGFLCGLLAGMVAAALYSLHCREPGLLFLGSWYMLGALIPALAGLAVGRRLIAWRN